MIFLVIYPAITYAYVKVNKYRIDDEDEDFIARNKPVFGPYKIDRLDKTRMSLAFFMVTHYRKIVYSIVIILMKDYSFYQI